MSPTSTLKLAIGSISGVPTEGYFTYSYQGDTVEIPYDADVTSFPPLNPPVGFVYVEKNANTLINSLPSIIAAGGVVVTIVNQKTFRIVFNNFGARASSSCDATTLRPSTNISVTRISTGGPSTKEVQHLRPKLLPIAYTDSFSASPSPVISITDIDSITKRISITPQPKFGTFTISNGTLTTSVLSINASASDVISALTSANINSSTRLYSVAKSGDYSWDIYRTSGTAETLTVTDSGMIGFESKFGVIDFNTIELEDYLGGAEKANATIEVEYSDGIVKQTLYQGTVSIVNDLIENSVYSPIPFPELSAGIGEAPMDGTLYGRKDGTWSSVIGDGNNIPDYDNGITYTVGNQVYYQGKLYRMQIAVGAAGYNPVAYPSNWESLSGSNQDLSNYVTKDGAIMNENAGFNFSSNNSIDPIVRSQMTGEGFVTFDSATGARSHIAWNVIEIIGNGATPDSTRIMPSGITFTDLSTQTTAAVNFNGGTITNDIVIEQSYGRLDLLGAGMTADSPDGFHRVGVLASDTQSSIFLINNYTQNGLRLTEGGIQFQDNTVQTTAAVTQDLSGYAQLSGATFESIVVDYDGSPNYPFRVVQSASPNTGVMIQGAKILVGEDPEYNIFGLYSYLSRDDIVFYQGQTGCSAGIYTHPTDPIGQPPMLRMQETDGTTGTNVTEVKQGRIYYDGVELYAPIASPALTGVPTAPTPLAADNSTTIATTAYVTNAVSSATTSPSTFKVIQTCRNATGSLIPARSVVYINGANGTHPTIQLAQANAESTSYRTFGITSADIANSADGTVVIIGEILNVNTGSFVAGDQLFLSPTVAGGITNVKPSAPDHMVYVGVCTRANTSNGSIEVKVINGFELNELHDVAIATKLDKQLVAYESSTNLWKNKSAATLGIAELSGATFTGKISATQSTTSAGIRFLNQNTYPTGAIAQNGDMWLTEYNLQYKDFTGTVRTCVLSSGSNTFTSPQVFNNQSNQLLPAVRINNLATLPTAHSFVVEDNTNPDTTAFIVDNAGNVGIGVNPATWTAANKLEVNGFITSTTATAGTNNIIVATTAFVKEAVVPQILNLSLTGFNYSTVIGWNTIVRISGATEMPIELPTDTQNNVPIGTQIVFIQSDYGQLNFAPMYGAIILSAGNKYKTSTVNSVATAIKVAANEWLIAGDLTT